MLLQDYSSIVMGEGRKKTCPSTSHENQISYSCKFDEKMLGGGGDGTVARV